MTHFTRFPRRLAAALLLVSLAACGSSDKDKDQYVERPVGQIYNAGMDALLDRNFTAAAKQFDEVERQHPYSVWATKAQLMSAYAYYEADKYDDAIVAIDRFIQLHPSNPDTPYAYYLKALCYYEQIADVGRDQRNTRQALAALDELTKRYPNSAYARDAQLKIDLTRDHLAGKEMNIGRFYLRQGQVLAAINRFRVVVDRYQTTSHVPEALHRLVESYTTLGMTGDATQVAAVLGYNYPGNEWYADTYAVAKGEPLPKGEEKGFFGRIISPPVTLGDNVDTSAEGAKRRAEEKARLDAELAREVEADRAKTGAKAAAASAPAPDRVASVAPMTPGEARAVDVAPISGRAPMPPDARMTGTGSAPAAMPSPSMPIPQAPAAAPPPAGNAYDEAIRNAGVEKQHAQDSLAYWTNAVAGASDPAAQAQAKQSQDGAKKAVEYWTKRESELRAGAASLPRTAAAPAAAGGAPATDPSATPVLPPNGGAEDSGASAGKSAAADENAGKSGDGWLSRTWKSVF